METVIMKRKVIAAVISGTMFIALIVLLKTYDVQPIGPEGTSVGFSHLNQTVHDITGVNLLWYDCTDYLGYAALCICALFGLAGLIQLIRRRSLLKVDRTILGLGVLYAVVIALYVLFEKVVINYRPIIMPEASAPEASFPSSHTMLIITVMGSAMMAAGYYLRNSGVKALVRIVCTAVIIVTVAGRLYSGVHWFTDIVGGILLSFTLLMLFSAFAIPEKSGSEGVYRGKH